MARLHLLLLLFLSMVTTTLCAQHLFRINSVSNNNVELRGRQRGLQPDASAPPEQQDVPITYLSYGAIVAELHALAAAAPQFVRLWTGQAAYGHGSPGACADANGAPTDCLHWFVTVTNFGNASAGAPHREVLPSSIAHRPQVFLSGNLHGDEQVGPMTLIYTLRHLVHTALAGSNPWINLLLDTRYIVAIPVTNPRGYFTNSREENGMDPNRDFPYAQSPSECMRTLTGRVLNEAFRSHMFQLAITFHGGMQAIAYEWGSANHMDRTHASESPDDNAQALLAAIMGNMAGRFQGDVYPVERINNLVYPVPGGMEDWAYASSWDTVAAPVCRPTTYGGYAPERTQYTPSQLRVINVLVETSDAKRPPEGALGSFSPSGAHALTVEGPGDGHVPRNMRLTYATIDLVAPYAIAMEVEVERASAGAAHAGGRELLRDPWSAAPPPQVEVGLGHAYDDVQRSVRQRRAARAAAAAAVEAALARGETPIDTRCRRPDVDEADFIRFSASYNNLSGATGSTRSAYTGLGSGSITSSPNNNINFNTRVPGRRGLTTGGTGASAAKGYEFSIGASYSSGRTGSGSAVPFSGPGPCFPSTSTSSPATSCTRYLREYSKTLVLPPPPPSSSALPGSSDNSGGGGGNTSDGGGPLAAARVRVAWDVGGAVTVDATSLAVGTWDVRVPPALLLAARVSDANSCAAPPASDDAKATAFASRLVSEFALTPVESVAFARYVHAWQLFLAGRCALGDIPRDVILRHSRPVRGVSRWVFGQWGTTHGAASAPPPDLTHRPLQSRFSDCFLVPPPPVSPSSSSSTYNASGNGGVSDGPCDKRRLRALRDLQQGQGQGQRGGGDGVLRDLQPGQQGDGVVAALQGYLLVPYAAVDANWASQVSPVPLNTPPQSHWANARTNADWHHKNGDWVVQGRLHAVGEPLFIAVGVEVPPPPPPASGSGSPLPTPVGPTSGPSAGGNDGTAASSSASPTSVPTVTNSDVCDGSLTAPPRPGAVDAAAAASADPPVVALGGIRTSTLVVYTGVVTMGFVGLLLVMLVGWSRRRRRSSLAVAAVPAAPSSSALSTRRGGAASTAGGNSTAGGTAPGRAVLSALGNIRRSMAASGGAGGAQRRGKAQVEVGAARGGRDGEVADDDGLDDADDDVAEGERLVAAAPHSVVVAGGALG